MYHPLDRWFQKSHPREHWSHGVDSAHAIEVAGCSFHHGVLFIMIVNQLSVKRTCNTMMAEKGCSSRVDAISFINLDQGHVHVSSCGHDLVIEMSVCR